MWSKHARLSSGKHPECHNTRGDGGPGSCAGLAGAGGMRYHQGQGLRHLPVCRAQTVVRKVTLGCSSFSRNVGHSLLQERTPPVCVSRRGVADRISQKSKFLCSYTLNSCSSPKTVRRSSEGRKVPVMSYSIVKTSAKWPKIKGSPVWEEGSSMMEKTFHCLVAFWSLCPVFNLRSKDEAKSPWKSPCIWHTGASAPASIIFPLLHMGAGWMCQI